MIDKKGIEIPVNLLVVLSISIIVLLAVIVFFMGGFGRGGDSLQKQQEFSSCATAYVRTGCTQDYLTFQCSSTAGDTLNIRAQAANIRGECSVKKAATCPSSTYPVGCDGGTGTSGGVSGGAGTTPSGASPSQGPAGTG